MKRASPSARGQRKSTGPDVPSTLAFRLLLPARSKVPDAAITTLPVAMLPVWISSLPLLSKVAETSIFVWPENNGRKAGGRSVLEIAAALKVNVVQTVRRERVMAFNRGALLAVEGCLKPAFPIRDRPFAVDGYVDCRSTWQRQESSDQSPLRFSKLRLQPQLVVIRHERHIGGKPGIRHIMAADIDRGAAAILVSLQTAVGCERKRAPCQLFAEIDIRDGDLVDIDLDRQSELRHPRLSLVAREWYAPAFG